jgi:photosystem II stability/assembly factor-like uncharacterized protein
VRRFLLLLLLLLPLTVGAAVNRWSSTGPEGGTITALSIAQTKPDWMYAGSDGGALFRSVDGGAHWRRAGRGLPGVRIDRIVISPVDANRLWIGTSAGVYRSSDAGESFLPRLDKPLSGFAVAPNDPTVLYAGTANVLRSDDAGLSWSPRSNGLPTNVNFQAVAVDAKDPNVAYIGTSVSSSYFKSFFKTDDGGATWRPLNVPAKYPTGVRMIVAHPAIHDLVYVATYDGVLRSTDGGATWKPTFIGYWQNAIVFDPRNEQRVWVGGQGGLWRSDDGGVSLTQMSIRAGINAVAIDPRKPDTMFLATDQGGVLRSDDTGNTWRTVSDGITANTISTFAADPSNADVVYAGTSGGRIFRTDDRGRHWLGPLGDFVTAGLTTPVTALAVNPGNSNEVFALGLTAIMRSKDRGATWEILHSFGIFASTNQLSALAIDPRSPNTIYVVIRGDGFYYTSGSLVRSTDDGNTWETVKLTGCATEGYTYFLGSFAVDPSSRLYLSAGYQLCTSEDAGANWHIAEGIEGGIGTLWAAPNGKVYAGTSAYGVFSTADGGATWTNSNAGLPLLDDKYVASITGAGNDLFAAVKQSYYYGPTVTQSLFRSRDGEHWVNTNLGLDKLSVGSVAASGSMIYAGTVGASVYTLDVVPLSIDSAGGDVQVTIKGSGFADGARVTIGGAAAADVAVIDDRTIIATPPPDLLCKSDVVVENPDGEIAFLRDAFGASDAEGPSARIAGSAALCSGGSAELTVGLEGMAPFTLEWSDGFVQSDLPGPTATRSVSPAASTIYSVRTVRDASCANGGEGSAMVTINPPAKPLAVEVDKATTAGANLYATVTYFNGNEYDWSIENGVIERLSASTVIFRAGDAGTTKLTARATNAQGCSPEPVETTIDVAPSSSTRIIAAVFDGTEVVLTNSGTTRADVDLTYTAAESLGAEGSGRVADTLEPGEQRVIPDILGYLRSRGLRVPHSTPSRLQGGSLLLEFRNLSSPGAGMATARREFVYPAFVIADNVFVDHYLTGLRETETETTDLEIVNESTTQSITLQLQFDNGDFANTQFSAPVTLEPLQWIRLQSVLATLVGMHNATMTVKSVTPVTAYRYARIYAVIRDRASNAASILAPDMHGYDNFIPLITEETELILTNFPQTTSAYASATLHFRPDGADELAPITVDIAPGTQQIIPSALQFLRAHGAEIPPGARGTLSTTSPYIVAAARSRVGVPSATGAYIVGYVSGLIEDEQHHASLGIVSSSVEPVTVQWELFDGSTPERVAASEPFTLGRGEARRFDSLLADAGIAQGYVRVSVPTLPVTGAKPFFVYGIVDTPSGSGYLAMTSSH